MTTYDVQAFRANPKGGDGIQSLADAQNNGQLVSGGQKLLQRVICRLFMRLGSMPYYPNAGTRFFDMLQVMGISAEQNIMSAFAGAQLQLVPQLQGEESSSDPADERFGSAKLNKVIITADQVFLQITVTSLANQQTTSILPLNFPIE